ncbi:hypothetical protein [Streptomyces mirabilis]|uniref:hypothetical protein n=1 Tax=Streptomyces mirabilis TaxID=68239 RepID=UPI0036B02D14
MEQPYGLVGDRFVHDDVVPAGLHQRTEAKFRRPPGRAYSSRPNGAPTTTPNIRP